uniref:Uncharacterized protein n=1 Tax=Romanomermis culicivorax TaxID=13658 RepID=A0A915I7J4_ROMCU
MLPLITISNLSTNQNSLMESLTRFRQRIKNGSKATGNPKNEGSGISSIELENFADHLTSLTKFSSALRNRPQVGSIIVTKKWPKRQALQDYMNHFRLLLIIFWFL